ncbi:hypothetical protein ES704_01000 [subsurface metagenome]|jgi:hypothetical protein
MERFIRKNMKNLDIFLEFFKGMDKFSIVAQNIGLAFVAILIPIAIAIFRDKNFETLDTNVILDRVINGKKLVTYLGIILLIPFLWYVASDVFINSISLLLWLFGIYIILRILGDCYKWMKGHKMNLRFNYLEALKNIQDMEESWHSVWQTKNVNIQNEREFFKIFSTAIDQLLKSTKKNLKTISKLLNDFYNFINNRSIAFLVIPEDVFPKILKWHFEIWQKKYELSGRKDKLGERSNYSEISRILNDIFNNTEERSLKERMAYSFFEHFKKYVKDCKKVLVKDANKQDYYRPYIRSLFTIFCRAFFKNIEKSPEKHDIWEFYFPEEWKIKKINYEKNIITKRLYSEFLQWARERIWQAKEEFDWDLDDISSNLFPEVEPILWAIILIFNTLYDGDRMESVIERSWNFGFTGRVRIYSGDIANSKEESRRKMDEAMQLTEEVEMKNTFELAYLLFKKEQFSKENLEKYLKSLRELEPEYKEDSEKEKKRLRLLNAFNEMLKFLIKQNDNII